MDIETGDGNTVGMDGDDRRFVRDVLDDRGVHVLADEVDALVDEDRFAVGRGVLVDVDGVAAGGVVDCVLDLGIVAWPGPADVQCHAEGSWLVDE